VSDAGWADRAVDKACARAADWYPNLPAFSSRVNLGSVVGYRHPALLSEQDCVMHFSRFLNESGVKWESMHHQVSVSRWFFDSPHPAATAGGNRWRVDLALVGPEDFLGADLPATEPGFQFDSFLEFAYLGDSWAQPGSAAWGEPEKGRRKVADDVEKVGRYLESGACRSAYAVVFEECDFGFPSEFVDEAEERHGCRVRFIKGYRP
jgi:hypothetical protein